MKSFVKHIDRNKPIPDDGELVVRGTMWGNPFHGPDSGEAYYFWLVHPGWTVRETARYCQRQGKKVSIAKGYKAGDDTTAIYVAKNIHKLAGKNLYCFCKPGTRNCHAATLAEFANTDDPKKKAIISHVIEEDYEYVF